MLPAFELARPSTVDQAIEELLDEGVPYAGGTELIAAMNIGLLAPAKLVDLKRIRELRGIRATSEGLVIGAATSHDEIAASQQVREYAPVLAEACSLLGNQRVRATGSIGGNICFADHRSDVSAALFSLDATVTLQSAEGKRTCPIDEFVLGELEVNRDSSELLRSVDVPHVQGEQVYIRHQPAEYPTACFVLTVRDGEVELVVGALTERPEKFRFSSLDEIDPAAIGEQLETIGDLNGSEEYKRHLGAVFSRRAIEKMGSRLGG